MENKAYKEPVKVNTVAGIDFYAVKETGWIPVSRCGLVLGKGGLLYGTRNGSNHYLKYKEW